MIEENKSQEVGPGKPPVEHQFKPGQSGNPAGKKKGTKNLSTILRELVECEMDVIDPFTKKTEKKKVSEILMLKLVKKGMNDEDLASIKEIFDRLEGKAAQRIDFGGSEDGSGKAGIKLEIIHTNDKPQGDSSPKQEPSGDNKDSGQ